jgi:hypothetical protein
MILEPKLEQGLRWYFGFGELHKIEFVVYTYLLSRYVRGDPLSGRNGFPPSITGYVFGFSAPAHCLLPLVNI